MAKQLNGIFRAWMRVKQADESAPPIIWGHCIVHLSHPEFCGNVLHTSSVLSIAEYKTFLIAETRNNYYALLGPELVMPADCGLDPESYVSQHRGESRKNDVYASAAMNANRTGTCRFRYRTRTVVSPNLTRRTSPSAATSTSLFDVS